MTPIIGTAVTVHEIDPAINNGSPIAAGVITRVWSEPATGKWTVNLRVILDGNDVAWLTSHYAYIDQRLAQADRAEIQPMIGHRPMPYAVLA